MIQQYLSRRRFLLQSTAALSLVAPVVAAAEGSVSDQSRTVSLGLAKDSAWNSRTHREFMRSHGLTDHAVVFYNLLSPDNVKNPYAWIQKEYLDRDIPVIFTLLLNGVNEHSLARSEISEGAAVAGYNQRVLDGYYDNELDRLIDVIVKDGRPIIVRHAHEWDGGWYGWGAYAEGNTVQSAIDAYIYVVNRFLAKDAPVRFELNLNRRDGKSPPEVLGDIDEWFPQLDPHVDMYSISTYNRCQTNKDSYQEWRAFKTEFGPAYDRLAERTDKPINVAEVATTDLCGPRLPWYVNMLEDIEQMYSQVEMVSYYFGTIPIGVASNDVPIEWGFPTDSQTDAFRLVLDHYRSRYKW